MRKTNLFFIIFILLMFIGSASAVASSAVISQEISGSISPAWQNTTGGITNPNTKYREIDLSVEDYLYRYEGGILPWKGTVTGLLYGNAVWNSSGLYLDGTGDYVDFGNNFNFTGRFNINSSTLNVGSRQGVAMDDDYFYMTSTTDLVKRYRNLTFVSQNTTIHTVTNTTHFGDPVVVGDKIYLVAENYTDCSDYSNMNIISVFASNLTVSNIYNITANNHEIAGITWDGSYFYITSYCDGSKIYIYNSDLSYNSAITLSQPLTNSQGIGYHDGHYYITNNNTVYKYDSNFVFLGKIFSSALYLQGIEVETDVSGLVIYEAYYSGSTGNLYTLRPPPDYVSGLTIYSKVYTPSPVLEQSIISRYQYNATKRQYDLGIKNNNWEFRCGSEDGTTATGYPYLDITKNPSVIFGIWNATNKTCEVLEGDNSKKASVYNYTLPAFSQNTTVGRLWKTPISAFFNGSISYLVIYGRSLTSSEIILLNNSRYSNSSTIFLRYDGGSGAVTYQIDVNATTPDNTNYTVWYANNGTDSYSQLGGILTGNNSLTIETKYQNTDVKVELYGNTTLTPELMQITFWTQGNLTFSGHVYNTLELPLYNAKIDYNGLSDYSNASGYFEFTNITDGTHSVLIRSIGYENVTDSIILVNDTSVDYILFERSWATTEDANNAGIIGFIGGILGGAIAAGMIRKLLTK